MTPRYLSAHAAAHVAGVDPRTITRAIAAGNIVPDVTIEDADGNTAVSGFKAETIRRWVRNHYQPNQARRS